MCYGITNSGDGAFSRTGAFNFVKKELLNVPKNVLLNRKIVEPFFRNDGNCLFLRRPEDETKAIAQSLKLEELNKIYFEAKERFAEASKMFQDILVKLEYAMENSIPAEKSPYFVRQ